MVGTIPQFSLLLISSECNFDLYSSSVISMMRSRRMRWTGHVPFMGKMRNKYKRNWRNYLDE